MPSLSGVRTYADRVRSFSRNAKLYLVATVLQGFSFGVWGVIFNLYLNLGEVGFQPDFISNMFTVGAIATGLIALPAGAICTRIGSKNALLVGVSSNVIGLVQIVVLQPSILLFASLASGLVGTLGWVASAPFMTDNSEQKERSYLFSLNWGLMILVNFIGSFVGGFMPDSFNSWMGLSTGVDGSAFGYRVALMISVCTALAAFIPMVMIKEKKSERRKGMVELLNLRNIESHRTLLKLAIPTAIIGFGAGFIVPLFNIFFQQRFSATTDQIGIIFALGSVTLAVGTLLAPVLSEHFGKVKSIVTLQYASMPFIMLITLSPNLGLSSLSYVVRGALMNMVGPIASAFQMELVKEEERATTNGLMVMSDSIPRAVTASVSGEMLTGSNFFTPFLVTTVAYFAASSLYYIFFRKTESSSE